MKVPTLERYAEALAYKREYAADVFPLVLARLGISQEELELAANRWSSSIAAGLQAASPDELLRFARSYSRVEHRIRTRHPQIGSISPLDGLEGPVSASPTVKPSPALRPIERIGSITDEKSIAVVVPSYLRPEAPSGQASTPSPMPPAQKAAPAFAAEPPPPPLPPPRAVSVPSVPIKIDMPPAPKALASTAPISSSIVAQGEEIARRRQALPFIAQGAAPAKDESAPPKDPTPKERLATGTVLHDGPMPIPKEAAVPFEEPSGPDPDLEAFPLERYAEVSIAIATTDDRAAVMSRFSLTEPKWKTISSRWGERVMKDPALQKRYGEVVKSLRARRSPSGQ